MAAQGIQRLNAALPWYALFVFMLAMLVVWGQADWHAVLILTAYAMGGVAVFAILLRTGWQILSGDPMLVVPQMLFNISLVSLAYVLVDEARVMALQILSLIIVFDMRRLDAVQTKVVAWVAAGLPLLAVCLSNWLMPGRMVLLYEALYVCLAACLVPALLWVSRDSQVMRDQQVRQRAQLADALVRLQQLSKTEGLTGLLNRRHMQTLLSDECRRMERSRQPFALAMLDIDWFKRVNDRFGHATGDQVLRQFAQLLKASFAGEVEHVARWGGEEFLILLPEMSVNQAWARLQSFMSSVHQYDWTALHADLHVTCSGGLAMCRHSDLLAQSLIEVDAALYLAKNNGRDQLATSEVLDSAWVAPRQATIVPTKPDGLMVTPSGLAASGETVSMPSSLIAEATWLTPLAHWIMSRDELIRHRLRLTLVPSGLVLVWLLVLQLWAVDAHVVTQSLANNLSAGMFLGAMVPYVLIRSGWSARWADPMLSLPQRLWFTWLIVMGYALVPQPRPLLMQLLCHVAVLGFVGLTPFGSRVMGWCMAGMLVALWGAMAWLHVPDFDPVTQALQLSMAVVVLSLINAQGYRYSVLRVEVAQEAQALQRAMDRLRMVMAHDALTGLPNRDEIQRLLEKECQRHALSGRAFSVALIDLDHFKRVNDGHGHGVGDQVLASFAQHVQFKLRDIDVVGRWGGEEFLVLLPETTSVLSAGLALDRVREHVAHQRLSASVPALRVTMSAGVAVHLPGEPLDSLIGRADAALYEAKHAGRNRVGTGVVHQG